MRHVARRVLPLIIVHPLVTPIHPQEETRVRRSLNPTESPISRGPRRVAVAVMAGAWVALAACGGAAGGGSPTASDVGVTKDQITIGATVPLSGPVAAYSTIAKASDAYFAYVNAHGGVNGRKIKYIYLDDN